MNPTGAVSNSLLAASRRVLLALLVLTGPAAGSAAEARPAGAERVAALRIIARKIEGGAPTIRLRRGERITLLCTSDERMTVHLHGYDKALELEPGVAGSMSVDAGVAGRFPVTLHLPAAKGAPATKHSHGPALAYLEVHPE